MHKTTILLFVAVALIASASPLATALSPREECEQAGGVYSKDGGTQACTFTETPGNNQGGVTKVEEETQKGSSRSSHPEEEENCVNNNGGSHCK